METPCDYMDCPYDAVSSEACRCYCGLGVDEDTVEEEEIMSEQMMLVETNDGAAVDTAQVVNKEVNMNVEVIVKGLDKLKTQIEGKSVKEAAPILNRMVHNIIVLKLEESKAKGFKTVTDRDICGFASYYKVLPENIVEELTSVAPVSKTQSSAMQVYLNEWKNEIYQQRRDGKFVVWYKEARSEDKVTNGKKVYYKSALRYWGLSK